MNPTEELAGLASGNWRDRQNVTPEDITQYSPIPFYPSEKHVANNWKPETSLSGADVAAIAAARRRAEDTGTLTPEVAKYMLPIAMTEGWGAGMGVKGDNAFYASQRFQRAVKNMGLEEGKDYFTTVLNGKDQHIVPIEGGGNGPRWAAAILGEKAAVAKGRGKSSPEDIIRAYNGKGRGTEDVHGDLVPADVDVYLAKVKQAADLLTHPKNYQILQHFTKEYKK